MKCPCGKLLDVDTHSRGKPAQCPSCGNVFVASEPITSTTAIRDGEPKVAAAARTVATAADVPDVHSIDTPWLMPRTAWVLLGILLICVGLGLAAYFLTGHIGTTLNDAAHMQTRVLTHACDDFQLKYNRWPENLEVLTLKGKKGIRFLASERALEDPWGGQYQYDVNGPRNNGQQPDIWTVSPDGETIGNWPKGR
jgi:Type II secretion system (T2SS), protein G